VRRLALVLVGLAAVAGATVVVVRALDEGGGTVRAGERPLAASASVTPARVLFGEPVSARIEVVADDRVDPASIRIVRDFAPFRVVSADTSRSRADGLVHIVQRLDLDCLSEACLPAGRVPEGGQPARTVPLGAVQIDYREEGAARTVSVPLQPVEIVSRLSSDDRAKPAGRLRAPTELPPLAYDVSPGSLSTAMIATAGALLGVALLLVVLAAKGVFRPAPREDPRSSLERALAAVEEAAARGDGRRLRVTLGWLARELHSSGRDEIAGDALRLAWSPRTPQATAVAALTRDVEEASRNGR
jgi:hypothetical protein